MSIFFRKATEADIGRITEIYSRIHGLEEAGRIKTGWKREIYPTEETARTGVAAGDMFVLVADGVIAASARINQEQVHPAYDTVEWKYSAKPREVMVIHTLTVDPEMSGKSLGRCFIGFYEGYAAESGCSCLRLDTNELNIKVRALYGSLGYREAGTVPCVFNGIPGVGLVCLEKRAGRA